MGAFLSYTRFCKTRVGSLHSSNVATDYFSTLSSSAHLSKDAETKVLCCHHPSPGPKPCRHIRGSASSDPPGHKNRRTRRDIVMRSACKRDTCATMHAAHVRRHMLIRRARSRRESARAPTCTHKRNAETSRHTRVPAQTNLVRRRGRRRTHTPTRAYKPKHARCS